MSATLSEITKSIQEIRKTLQDSLTPEFLNSVKASTEAVTKIQADPNVSQNTKEMLNEFNRLLKEAADKELIGEVVKLTEETQKKLTELEMPVFNGTLRVINNLLVEAKNANLIEHIVDAMKAVKSIGDFVALAKQFMEGPVGSILINYGAYGLIVGSSLRLVLSKYLEKKNDSKSLELLRETNQFLSVQTIISLEELREAKWKSYKKLSKELHNGELDFDPELLQKAKEKKEDDLFFINTIPKIPKEKVLDLAAITNKLEDLLKKFAEPEIKNENLNNYLGYIGKGYKAYWNDLLNYLIYSHKTIPLRKPNKPELSRHERNYNSICRLYGSKEVQTIMLGLMEDLAKNGGDALYYELANSLEDSPGLFLIFAQYISQEQSCPPQTLFPPSAVQLQTYYHDKAENYIREQWQKTKWPLGQEQLRDALDDTMVEIIKVRAFAEFCQSTACYFFGLYPLPRELYNGVLDIPRGLWHTLRHPIETIQGLGTLFTKEGWANLGQSLIHHPLRVLTPALLPGACSYGLGQLSLALTPATEAGPYLLLLKQLRLLRDLKDSVLNTKTAAFAAHSLLSNISATADTQEPSNQFAMSASTPQAQAMQVSSDDWIELLNHLVKENISQATKQDAHSSQEIVVKTCALNSPLSANSNRFFTSPPLSSEKAEVNLKQSNLISPAGTI